MTALPTRERRPRQGAVLQDPRLADGRINTSVLPWADLVAALADVLDGAADDGWDVVDLAPWLGMDRQPIGEVTFDCGDGTQLVLHVSRRRIREATLLRVGGGR